MLTAYAVVRERERGTLEQLLVTPVSAVEMILGKLVPYLILGFCQLILVLFLMTTLFRVPIHGSVLLLAALSLIYLTSLLSLGLMISARSTTQIEATQAAQAILLPSIMLSGYIFPLSSLPLPLRILSHVFPATHFIAISRGIIIRGASFHDLIGEVLSLAIISFVLLAMSVMLFRKSRLCCRAWFAPAAPRHRWLHRSCEGRAARYPDPKRDSIIFWVACRASTSAAWNRHPTCIRPVLYQRRRLSRRRPSAPRRTRGADLARSRRSPEPLEPPPFSKRCRHSVPETVGRFSRKRENQRARDGSGRSIRDERRTHCRRDGVSSRDSEGIPTRRGWPRAGLGRHHAARHDLLQRRHGLLLHVCQCRPGVRAGVRFSTSTGAEAAVWRAPRRWAAVVIPRTGERMDTPVGGNRHPRGQDELRKWERLHVLQVNQAGPGAGGTRTLREDWPARAHSV
jgi:hypothetical protein